MRTLRTLACAAAISLSVAACASASSAGWTFSPTQHREPVSDGAPP